MAYDDLKDEDPSLVTAYEKVLSRQLDKSSRGNVGANVIKQDQAERQAQMQRLLRAGLKKTEREARVMMGAGDAVNVVLSAKNIIDSAVQAVPQAALAWTGVCLALQVCYICGFLTCAIEQSNGRKLTVFR